MWKYIAKQKNLILTGTGWTRPRKNIKKKEGNRTWKETEKRNLNLRISVVESIKKKEKEKRSKSECVKKRGKLVWHYDKKWLGFKEIY